MVSPGPVFSSELSSKTSAILVASIDGEGDISTTVGSSMVFPSVSSPSSLTSLTSLVFPGLLPIAVAEFSTFPLVNVDDDML